MRARRIKTAFDIDFSNVTFVGSSALMYLIAIVNDAKNHLLFKCYFTGNFPIDGVAKERLINSGFLKFVHAQGRRGIVPESRSIQIRQGRAHDPDTAKDVCVFIQTCCSLSRIDTIPLYNILLELMGNTYQHAYDTITEAGFWYLFAEETEDFVEFVFLDTGLGIPTTVQKRFRESITAWIGLVKDSSLIVSALKGEFRTKTKETYRGKGLPQIFDCFKSGLLCDGLVYSGAGSCMLGGVLGDKLNVNDFDEKLFGTLYSWRVSKKGNGKNDNN